MESPFFLSDWLSPTVRDVRGVPVKHRNASSPAPKVVSIPVQFVSSERARSDSALKIQKVFRGFLVRKSVKKIVTMAHEVDAIAEMISAEETVELMRKDSKEGLKVSETLMSLLIRLDSIRGVDPGVRDCRKAVIKKAIGLQEMIDSIVVADKQFEVSVDAAVESDNAKIACQYNSQETEADAIQPVQEQEEGSDLDLPTSSSADHVVDQRAEQDSITEPPHDCTEPGQNNPRSANGSGEEREEREGPRQTESQSGFSALHQNLIEECEVRNMDNTSVKQEEDKRENNGNHELLERMLEDNEKMMGLISELFERNEMQTRLLCSLSRRVEKLERALTSGQKRKKKRNAAGAVDCLDPCKDAKRCGKKE